MLRRDNIFHPRDRKKQYSKKKGKKKESNHLVTRTGLAPLRNFVIPFRFDHDHGEKKRIPCYIPSMKFTDRRDLIDPSFISLFLYILSNSFPSLVLFSSSSFLLFFRNRSRAVGKKEKMGYADTWRLKGNEKRRERERERSDFIILLFILRGSSPPRPISRVYIQPLLPPPINSLFRQFLLWKTVIELDSVINNSPIVLLN